MKHINYFLTLLVLVGAYSCAKIPPIDVPPPAKDSSYSVTESFESGRKAAYALADVDLRTGSWSFNDALIGNTAADTKDSSWSVRLRNGSITTNFKITGLKKVYVSSATYGTDGPSTWNFQTSTDGQTFTNVGSPVTVSSKTFQLDSFLITSTDPVQVRIIKTGTTRINIDNIIFTGASNNPGFKNVTDTLPTGDSTVPAAGRYVVPGSDAPPALGDNSNLLFGNPSGADSVLSMANNYLINQFYYIESYSSSRATPNWVSWHLDATNITGVADRQNDFAAWAGLYSGWYKVQSSSYMGSGYDRGHNCPSADRTSSVAANSSTFLMTNMIPQTPQNNQQTWNNLEQYIRTQVTAGKEAYVIMGSYGNAGTIDNGRITVPTNVWKVIVFLDNGNSDLSRVSATTRVLAVNTPNTSTVSADWKQYITTVRDIETATGYNLLSSLSTDVQNAVETQKDPGQ
ncbi:DNA/RNA non-specific endonuclease [Niabella soli]|uniref:Endonuclease n=1 Tax=Niabella soli DSM 19437 TaxID=929713 RepID=W0F4U2_9BACT|nr:DNA/RNA non-specific endonuclease [Niabella soli]AHF16479.1 endonuclease [Niabella soli DSM 19437]